MKTFSIFVTSFIPVFMSFPTEKQNEYKYLSNMKNGVVELTTLPLATQLIFFKEIINA